MFQRFYRRVLMIFSLMVVGLGGSMSAEAGVPVIDVANLAQAIQQVLSWAQQLEGMAQQYEQLQTTYESLTGARGMQSLMPVSIGERNYLPTTTAELQGVMTGQSASYSGLAAQVRSNVQSNAVLTPAQVSGLSISSQAFLSQSRQSTATLSALSSQTQTTASQSFSKLQGLIAALGSTQDTKASADLSGRIQSEQVMTQNSQVKTEALYHAMQAQALQNQQMARELAVQSLGTMASRPAIQW